MIHEIHYKNSPLTEAVLDIRVQLPTNVRLATLLEIYAHIQSDYPTKRDHFHVEGEIEFGEEVVTTGTKIPNGYLFVNEDEHQFFQAKLDGFTFNRLRPYTNWSEFRAEAYRLWSIYRKFTNPELVTRIALRYINRLELPLPFSDFTEFLRVVPEIPNDFPNPGLSNYFMQLRMPQDDILSMLYLNEGFALPENIPVDELTFLPVILDLDLFRELSIPTNDQEVWKLFDQLRLRKNEVFEACITDRMREVIR